MSSISRKDYPGVTRPAPLKNLADRKITRSMTGHPKLASARVLSAQAHQQKGPITRSMSREQIITTKPVKQGLFDAITAGDTNKAKALLRNNPGLAQKSIYDPEFQMRVPFVHIATILNDRDMTQLLLRYGAKPEAVDGDGSTAIDHASYDILPLLERR